MRVGDRIDETGALIREDSVFYLRRDAGGRFQLDLHRLQLGDKVGRVRLIGVYVSNDLVDVDEMLPLER